MSLLVAASNPLQAASGLPRRVANRRAAAACLALLAGSVLAVSGCSGQGSETPAGIYTVAAFDAELHSKHVTFALTGRGPAAPKSRSGPVGP